MAAGILAIGFMLIATLFPVGMKMTATATERTVASVAADEAFAKIRLYGVNLAVLAVSGLDDFYSISDPCIFSADEFGYPSAENISSEEKRYFWSALCGNPNGTLVPVTVFISRKADAGAKFPYQNPVTSEWESISYPKPIQIVRVNDPDVQDYFTNEIDVHADNAALAKYVVAGSIIIDNKTGLRMTVLTREQADSVVEMDRRRLILADAVEEALLGNSFWVIPPAVRNALTDPPTVGGRNPCVGVYQRVIGF